MAAVQARSVHGLAVTVHTAELKQLSEGPDDPAAGAEDETTAILRFNPERVGHALFLQQAHLDAVREYTVLCRCLIIIILCTAI